jgi:hypothetical protein
MTFCYHFGHYSIPMCAPCTLSRSKVAWNLVTSFHGTWNTYVCLIKDVSQVGTFEGLCWKWYSRAEYLLHVYHMDFKFANISQYRKALPDNLVTHLFYTMPRQLADDLLFCEQSPTLTLLSEQLMSSPIHHFSPPSAEPSDSNKVHPMPCFLRWYAYHVFSRPTWHF